VLHLSDAWGTGFAEEMVRTAGTIGATVRAFHFEDQSDIGHAMEQLYDSKLSVIVALAFEDNLPAILTQAEALGMLEGEHAWIIPEGTIIARAFDESHRLLLDGALTWDPDPNGGPGFERFISALTAMTAADCANPLFSVPSGQEETIFARGRTSVGAYAYDGVVALALALSAAGAVHGTTDVIDGNAVHQKLLTTNFEGASGRILFTNDGDRNPATAGFVMRNLVFDTAASVVEEHVVLRVIGDAIELENAISWQQGKSEQPVDRVYQDELNERHATRGAPLPMHRGLPTQDQSASAIHHLISWADRRSLLACRAPVVRLVCVHAHLRASEGSHAARSNRGG
jgi:hypothetical protein